MNYPSIDQHLLTAICQKLGLHSSIPLNLDGLNEVYHKWCHRIPFDNIRKLIALNLGEEGQLPGGKATDFFEAWLQYGTGGTCWSSSNALFTLLIDLGFDARRVSGSMRNTGKVNHGSIIVRLEDNEWLVDSSILCNQVLPLLHGQVTINDDPLVRTEIESNGRSYRIWFAYPSRSEMIPCQLIDDPVSLEYYLAHYEASRQDSPFNDILRVRRNFPGEIRVLQANTLFVKTATQLVKETLSAVALKEALQNIFGISQDMISRWEESGALEISMQTPSTGSLNIGHSDLLSPSERADNDIL